MFICIDNNKFHHKFLIWLQFFNTSNQTKQKNIYIYYRRKKEEEIPETTLSDSCQQIN